MKRGFERNNNNNRDPTTDESVTRDDANLAEGRCVSYGILHDYPAILNIDSDVTEDSDKLWMYLPRRTSKRSIVAAASSFTEKQFRVARFLVVRCTWKYIHSSYDIAWNLSESVFYILPPGTFACLEIVKIKSVEENEKAKQLFQSLRPPFAF